MKATARSTISSSHDPWQPQGAASASITTAKRRFRNEITASLMACGSTGPAGGAHRHRRSHSSSPSPNAPLPGGSVVSRFFPLGEGVFELSARELHGVLRVADHGPHAEELVRDARVRLLLHLDLGIVELFGELLAVGKKRVDLRVHDGS